MNPLIALIVSEIAKQVPVLAIDIVEVLSRPTVTAADWDALREKWNKSMDQRMAEARARAES